MASLTPTEERKRRISVRTKLAFSSGSLEEAMIGAAGIATMIFYNQVLGVSAALCGTAFMIASIVDAISDPLIGALSDSIRTRWGRRHPFMFLSAFPLALCFYLMYQPPEGSSEYALFWWFTVTMVGLRLSKTFYAVPHSALGAELTDDYNERTSIFGWNWVVGMAGGIALYFVVLYLIFPTTPEYENGLLNPDRYQLLALFGAVFCFLAIMVCTFATSDQIPYLHQLESLQERTKRAYKTVLREIWINMKALVVNPSYLSVCLCWLILAISGGVIAVVGTYAFIYGFDFTTEQIFYQQFVRLPGALLAVVLAAWLTSLLDKKYTVISMIAFTTFMIGLPYCLRLLGWFPENGSDWLIPAFLLIWAVAFTTLPIVPIVIDSQLVDVADDHELKTGNRAEGIIFSVRTFAIKLTQGLGGLIGGFGLEFIGFPENATKEMITPEMVNGLFFMMGPLYYIIVYGGLGFAFMYKIDKARHDEILKELEVRRKQQVEAEPSIS
ncbi:MAG: MFS transporter [Pseudomonadota bacterium]